jgi:hypothetical protein
MVKQDSVYIASHSGLGDNICMFGALFFLSNYYEKIYFVCRDVYYDHLQFVFDNNIHKINITLLPFDTTHEDKYNTFFSESSEVYKLLYDKWDTSSDIMTCLSHKLYTLPCKITHPDILQLQLPNTRKIAERYHFIKMFYNDINLDLSIYLDYFHIEFNHPEITKFYNKISHYKIIFIHSLSSIGEINIPCDFTPYINDDEYFIVCANKNMYDNTHEKYNLANEYVWLPNIFLYYDILLHSEKIHVVDSSISSIVLPLYYKQKLKSNDVNIYHRETSEKIILSFPS